VDGVARRAVELPGLFRVVLFWPDDLSLAKSGPEHRRRLLNQMLVQIEPGYAGTLARYTRVVEQRNHLLKQIAAREQALDALEVWDLELLSTGAAIVRARAAVVEDLRRRAAQTHARIAPGEMLEVGYVAPPGDLAGALAAARPEDLRRGVTTIGPHRDDLLIALEGRETRAYASQGQQRTAVVSIKLAEARVIESRSGEAPVLLLDDVLSELDAGRRAALLEQLMASGQVIITSVEAEPFPPEVMHRARVSHIEEGRILADD
jgi:DNA replication and repair protein RecF